MSDYLRRIFGGPTRKEIDMQDGSFAERFLAQPPATLLTDNGGSGPNARLRVDVAQTGFFAGREFRTFKEFSAATTSTYVIKIVTPINVILFEFGLEIEAGTIRIETISGGSPVEGGSFSENLPRIPANTMTEKPQPPYATQISLTAGGTLTGGTVIDVLRAKAADNSNFAASVGAEAGAERGVQPGTYYWRASMTGFVGVIKARYEERP